MNTFDKIVNVLAKNLGYTIVLVVAIVLFAVFSDGVLAGLITAFSALIGYASAVQLWREFKRAGTAAPKTKNVPAQTPVKKTPVKSVKKKNHK